MDLRKEAEKLKTDLSSDSLADITSECNKLMTLQDEIKKIEERLKELQLDSLTDADWKLLDNSFQNYLSQFKDGISDALLLGKSADVNLTSFYKQGYDFGITMYCKMEGLDD